MKVRKVFPFALVGLALVIINACVEAPRIGLPVSSPKPAEQIRIIPIKLDISPPQNGWQSVNVEAAFENISGQWSSGTIETDSSVLVTKEGYSYPVSTSDWAWMLPPGFRFHGYVGSWVGPYTIAFKAQIAQNTHVQKLVVPMYGDIDLENISPVTFPGGDSYRLKKIGDVLEIPGKGRISVLSFSREADRITAVLRFENLDKGYETSLQIGFIILGDDGFLRPATLSSDYGYGSPKITAGPAQTIETNVGCSVEPSVKNLRLILTTGDVNEVYDTGY